MYKHLKMTNGKEKKTNKQRKMRKKKREMLYRLVKKGDSFFLWTGVCVCLPQCSEIQQVRSSLKFYIIHTRSWEECTAAAKLQVKHKYCYSSSEIHWRAASWPLGLWNLLKCQVNGCQTKTKKHVVAYFSPFKSWKTDFSSLFFFSFFFLPSKRYKISRLCFF